MSKVIQFVDQIVKHRGKEAKHAMAMRQMNHWYFRNRRLMQEAAEKKKALKEQQE